MEQIFAQYLLVIIVRLTKLQLRKFRLSLKQQQIGKEKLQGSSNGAIEIATGPGKADKLTCFLVEDVGLASIGGPGYRFLDVDFIQALEGRVGRLASSYRRISVPEGISNLLLKQGMVLASV